MAKYWDLRTLDIDDIHLVDESEQKFKEFNI
jgi:hypothetical protein